jgi:hypothetical protein
MNAAQASLFLCLSVSAWAAAPAPDRALRVPQWKLTEVLLHPLVRDGVSRYPAFPALLPVSANRALLTYKDGRGHTHDPGAEVATMIVDFTGGTHREASRFTPPSPLLYQCAEPVRFSDGRIALFLDTQFIGPEPRHYRAAMRWTISSDQGATFPEPEIFPVVDGTGYGYPQEGLTRGNDTWLMVMSFGYLPGGRWTMDVLHTGDAGRSWRKVRDLAVELNVPGFNEGGMISHGDGFLVVSRDYVRRARLHEVDREFRLRRQVDLTAESPHVQSYIGRPRLLRHQGRVFVLGRNWTRAGEDPDARTLQNPLGFKPAQQLCLLRIDLATLRPDAVWVLDNAEHGPVSDGYYAVAQTTGPADDERLHVITYKAVEGGPPSLVRFEFKWKEFLAE